MKRDIKFFIAMSVANLRNAYVLRTSFWIGVVSMVLNNLTFFAIWLLFMNATGPINGWTSVDVIGMIGVSTFCFGVCHSFFYGVKELPEFVVKGTFDSVLLAPVSSFVKLAGLSFSVTAYGDLLMGISIMIFYGFYLKFTLVVWLLFIMAALSGCVIFICFRLLISLIVFFVYDGELLSTQMMDIFMRPGLYPGGIFPYKLKVFLLTAIPILITSAMPIDIIKSESITLLIASICVAGIWVIITKIMYQFAIKRYESGNMLR